MADVTLRSSASNNGTTSPATPSSITAQAGNLLIATYALIGTSPTVGAPAGGWTNIQAVSGASVTLSVFMLPNNTGGAFNPSSTLGGTVTGWIASIYEFSQTGANCQLQGSAQASAATQQLTNIFSGQGQMIPNLLFIYTVARATASIIAQNTGLTFVRPDGLAPGASGWSGSIQGANGVQGLSYDFFWGSNLAQGTGPFPSASGFISVAEVWKQVGAWFNTTATQPSVSDNIGGNSGIYVPPFYQGMIGG